ncbi:MAG: hypothetical protein U0451_02745 [Candidatus Saccharimonadales bacterium]
MNRVISFYQRNLFNKILVVICVTIALIVGMLVIGPYRQKAHAAVISDGSDLSPWARLALNSLCTTSGNDVAQYVYVSRLGDPQALDITITNPGQIVQLQYNVVVNKCKPGNPTGIVATVFRTKSGVYRALPYFGDRAIPGIFNQDRAVPGNLTNATPYAWDSVPFNVDTTGMAAPGGDISGEIFSKQFNWFTTGNIRGCVVAIGGPNVTLTGGMTVEDCPTASSGFVFRINIGSPDTAPTFTSSADCSTAAAGGGIRANNVNDPQGSVWLEMFIENNAGAFDRIADVPNFGGGNYSVDFPSSYKDAYSRTVIVRVHNNTTGTSGSAVSYVDQSITVPPCVVPTCTIDTSPSPPEVNQNFQLVISYQYTPGIPNGRPLNSPQGRGSFNGSPQRGPQAFGAATSVILSGPPFNMPTGGTFPASGFITYTGGPGRIGCNTITGATPTPSCPSGNCISIASKPYFKIYGNDAMAGSTYANVNTCSGTPTTDATFIGFNPAGSTIPGGAFNYQHGAGAQYALFALGTIVEVPSLALKNYVFDNTNLGGIGPANIYPNRQTFSNVTAAGLVKDNYGGESDISRCMPDFWSKIPSSISIGGYDSVDIGSSGTAALRPGTGVIALINSNITVPFKQVVYIDGDARIGNNQNIQYPNFTNADNASSLTVIVRGNLYIDDDTTRLDGTYIAQPLSDGTKGLIITCFESDGNGRPFNDVELADGDKCGQKLTVNGALIAKQVIPLRTIGNYRDGSTPELPGSPSIAEEFDFGPEIYLQPPNLTDTNAANNKSKYDAINVLPPVF